jgi:LacI family transcriptional regulator
MARHQHKVTILDVAKAAGVSHTTVSRVLNNSATVREETRQNVLEAIRRLEYVANPQARSLAGGKSKVIGLLVPDLGTGYIGEIIRGIDAELGVLGYDLLLYTTHRTAAKEANYVTNLAQGLIDGLLLVLPRNPVDYISALTKRKFPFVLIDHQGNGENCAAVGATNWQGAYNACEYLIKLGHQRIGFITGALDLGAALDRLEGYKSALRTYHIPIDPQLIYEGTFHQPDGYTGAAYLLGLDNPPTAIFASNDVMAMAAMDAARDQGLHIPEDISIIGFDDIPQAALVRPALTTVRQPLELMGRVATQMLFDIINNPLKKMERLQLPTELIIRDSTTKPKDRSG